MQHLLSMNEYILKGWQLLQFVKNDVSDEVMVVNLLTAFYKWSDEVMNTGGAHGMTKRVFKRLTDDVRPLEPNDGNAED